MAKKAQKRKRSADALGKIAPQLLQTPLAYILADHHRQRELFSMCEELAEENILDLDLAHAVSTFLETEMVLHVIDEEEDLFPMLRRRLLPDDDVERVMGNLSGEHAADEAVADEIVRALQRGIETQDTIIEPALRNELRAFADRQRRHLAVENAIVMPLAASRLSKKDIADLGRRMAVRRGINQARNSR